MVVAQRLMRCVCPDCVESCEVSEEMLAQLGLTSEDLVGATARKGKGCMHCGFTGYRGRVGVFEVMPVNQQIRDQITAQVSKSSISYLSRASGILTVRESALIKAKEGVTTFEEVLRVTSVDVEPAVLCHACGHEIEPSFSSCPFCQADLGGLTCSSCSKPLQPGWSSCPFCSTTVGSDGSDPDTRERSLRSRILVVDDDPASNVAMQRLFPEFDVLSAMSAEEGLRLATLERPDGIILDLNLPDGSGTDVIKQLRSRVATSLIPVMMLTGTHDKMIETENLRAGVDDYVTKPINRENLRVRLEILLKRRTKALIAEAS